MAENKTKPTDASVEDYLASIQPPARQAEARTVCALMQRVSGAPPVMWGESIVGFGSYHYKYDSGREGDFLLTGFANRSANLSLYIMGGFPRHAPLMAKLGKYKTGASCLYVKKLADVDMTVLEELVAESVAYMRATYPTTTG